MQRKTLYSRNFILFLIGQIISVFGNQILRYAIPLYLLNKTGSPALLGTISAVAFIPMLVMYPIGGIIADQFNKKNIMVVLDFTTAVLVILFCLLEGVVNIIPLIAIVMLFLYSIQGVDQPAVKASVSVLVSPEHMMKANSVVDVINSLASIMGPVLGGILYSIFGLTPVLYTSIVFFFGAVVVEIFTVIPFEKKQRQGTIFATGIIDLKDSFRFLFKEQSILLKVSLVSASANLLLTSLVLIGAPVIITQHLGFSASAGNRLYGYSQGVIAAGAVVGGLLAGLTSKKMSSKASTLLLRGYSLSIFIVGIAIHMFKNSMAIYLVMVVGFGLLVALSTIFQIQIMTWIQILSPKDLIGKVISCVICINMCANPIGQLVYGIIFEHIGNLIYLPFYIAPILMIYIAVFTRPMFGRIDNQLKTDRGF